MRLSLRGARVRQSSGLSNAQDDSKGADNEVEGKAMDNADGEANSEVKPLALCYARSL